MVKFWFSKTCSASVKAFLMHASENMEFLFLPSIPALTSNCVEENAVSGQGESRFSMQSPFSQLHGMAFQGVRGATDIAELDSYYSSETRAPTHPIDVENTKWLNPSQLIQRPEARPSPSHV